MVRFEYKLEAMAKEETSTVTNTNQTTSNNGASQPVNGSTQSVKPDANQRPTSNTNVAMEFRGNSHISFTKKG